MARPAAPLDHGDEKHHRRLIAGRANASLALNDDRSMELPLKLATYTVAGVPTASDWTGAIIYVSNETGGATIAFSDGTNWRRAQDRAIVS